MEIPAKVTGCYDPAEGERQNQGASDSPRESSLSLSPG
jgi:hypothetical protein